MSTYSNEAKENTKAALIKTPAGMRFVAYLSLMNKQDYDRLETYINESFHEMILMTIPTKSRVLDAKATIKLNGRLKVKEILHVQDQLVGVALESEKQSGLLYCEIGIQEEYPHLVSHYFLAPMTEFKPESEDSADAK